MSNDIPNIKQEHHKLGDEIELPKEIIESLARTLVPELREYFRKMKNENN